MTGRWDAEAELDRLLRALEAELVAGPEVDLHAALIQSGRARGQALEEVRAVLDTAIQDAGVPRTGVAPLRVADSPGIWRH